MTLRRQEVAPLLVNRSDMAKMLGCCRKKTYKLQSQDNTFPRAVRDACGTAMFRVIDIEDYVAGLPEDHSQ